jgi:hypothetical protein
VVDPSAEAALLLNVAASLPKLALDFEPDPASETRSSSPDFSYRVGFRAAVTRLAAEPMKRVVVVG